MGRELTPEQERPLSGFLVHAPMGLVRWAGRGFHRVRLPGTLPGPAGTLTIRAAVTKSAPREPPLINPDLQYRLW
jgi:hypothetical protein